MQCFLCKKNNFELVYSLKTKNILRCKNDGLFVTDVVTASKNIAYEKGYFDNAPHPLNSNRKYFLNKLIAIKQVTANQKPYILDIGCGWGDFEEALEKEKIPYLGIDTSQEAIKICQKKGLNCKLLTIQQLNNETMKQSFSAIIMFQVIEHLKNPLPLLQSARKLLKKNGIILITTPNNDSPIRKLLGHRWSVYNEPSHHIFYNKKTLAKTLDSLGFKNIQVHLDSWRFLSSKYIASRLKQMYFPTFDFSLFTFNFPLPTDPSGDLEITAVKC